MTALNAVSSTATTTYSNAVFAGSAMASVLQQVVFLAALTTALAAVDPCSEVYPGLGVDFATTQTKVIVCLTPSKSCAMRDPQYRQREAHTA